MNLEFCLKEFIKEEAKRGRIVQIEIDLSGVDLVGFFEGGVIDLAVV
jgi:hypothetical protein